MKKAIFALLLLFVLPAFSHAYTDLPSPISPSGVAYPFNQLYATSSYAFFYASSSINTDTVPASVLTPYGVYPSLDWEAIYAGTYGNGTYTLYESLPSAICGTSYADCESNAARKVVYYRIAGVWTSSYTGPPDVDACISGGTRICDFNPQTGQVFATTTPEGGEVDFDVGIYVNEEDVGLIRGIRLTFRNVNQNILGYVLPDVLDPNEILFITADIHSEGYFSYATTSVFLDSGNYRIEACLLRSYGDTIVNPLENIIANNTDCQSHQFIVGEGTFVGNISQNSWQSLNGIFASTSATSTASLANQCNPISSNVSTLFLNTNFSTIGCLSFLFIPDSYLIQQSLINFKDNALTHFPIGYFTDFVDIITDNATSTLPVIDATVPNGVIGTGSHIRLDLSHSLDYVLNATSSQFNNASASSTETFYQITSRYWRYILYVLLTFYLLGRILSSTVIPKVHHNNTKT